MARNIRSNIPHVALLIETSREVGRRILQGIERYIRQHGPWAIHVWPGDLLQRLPDMKSWGGTGIIARIMYPEVEQAVLKSGLPTVAIDLFEEQKTSSGAFHNCSEVHVDTAQVGRMGAEHLIQKGFEAFAYVGEVNNVSWSRQRGSGFCQRLKESGFAAHCYPPPPKSNRDWGKEMHRLGAWLLALPKPIGLMAVMDLRGRQVIEACYHYDINVPNEVAVLGADNDQLVCNLCAPPMSSIALDAETGGYQAAKFLDIMMQECERSGKTVQFSMPPMRFAIQPLGVISRLSTELLKARDELVVAALKFIHINASLPLTVAQVASYLDVSRRTLETRFQKHLNTSVHAEIIKSRLARVKSLLYEKNMSIHEIAQACGFESETYLYRFFKRETGQTLSQFRKSLSNEYY